MKQIAENVYIKTVYPGVNIGCIIGARGAICIDTPSLPQQAQSWRKQVEALGGKPIRYVVYTSGHCDRIWGSRYLGGQAISHEMTWRQIQEYKNSNACQNTRDMLTARDPQAAEMRVILPKITFTKELLLYIDEQPVELLWSFGTALWVRVPAHDILFAGDTVVIDTHPLLAETNTLEWLRALRDLRRKRFQADTIVPGRGPVCDKTATKFTSRYIARARAKVRGLYRAGRPKSGLNVIADDLLQYAPPSDEHNAWLYRQIKLGLEHVYEEIKAAEIAME